MDNGGPRHLAYLLRLWQSGSAEHVTWRASLESAYTGERRAFSSLAALFDHLLAQTSGSLGPHRPPNGADIRPEGEPEDEPGSGPV